MTTLHRMFVVGSALGLVATVACNGRARTTDPARTAAAPCTGVRYLEVENNRGRDVEIYTDPPLRLVGVAGPGRTRLTLSGPTRADQAFQARHPDGSPVVGLPGSSGGLSYSYGCEMTPGA